MVNIFVGSPMFFFIFFHDEFFMYCELTM